MIEKIRRRKIQKEEVKEGEVGAVGFHGVKDQENYLVFYGCSVFSVVKILINK